MKKSNLTNFIKKYHLDGLIDSVKLQSDGKDVIVKFTSDDKTIIGAVQLADVKLPEAEFGINTTSNLLKILNSHEEEVELDLAKHGDKFRSINLADKDLKSTYILADPDVIINKAGIPKNLPPFEVELDMDKVLMEKYLKAYSALAISNVALSVEGNNINFIIGHSQNNTNRMTLTRELKSTTKMDLLNFSSESIKKIFTANKDFDDGVMLLSSAKLLKFRFRTKDIVCEYYVVPFVND